MKYTTKFKNEDKVFFVNYKGEISEQEIGAMVLTDVHDRDPVITYWDKEEVETKNSMERLMPMAEKNLFDNKEAAEEDSIKKKAEYDEAIMKQEEARYDAAKKIVEEYEKDKTGK